MALCLRFVMLVQVGALLAGCGSNGPSDLRDPPDEPGVPATVSIIEGDEQIAQVATALPTAIRVRVLDAQARGVEGQIVNFVVVTGGGTVFAGAAQTNAAGEALERWTLGPTAGTQILEVRAIDQSTGDPIVFGRAEATATAGPMTQYYFERPWVRVSADSTFDVRARGVDAYGNAVPTPTVTSPNGTLAGAMLRLDTLGFTSVRMGDSTMRVVAHIPARSFIANYRGTFSQVDVYFGPVDVTVTGRLRRREVIPVTGNAPEDSAQVYDAVDYVRIRRPRPDGQWPPGSTWDGDTLRVAEVERWAQHDTFERAGTNSGVLTFRAGQGLGLDGQGSYAQWTRAGGWALQIHGFADQLFTLGPP